MDGDFKVRDLSRFLTWSADTELLDLVCNIHRAWIWRRLSSWSASASPNLLDAIRALPDLNQQRLILSPQVCFLLRSKETPTNQEISAFMALLEAEEYLCGRRQHMMTDAVTGMGDYVFLHSGPAGALRVMQNVKIKNIVLDPFNLRSYACWPPDSGSKERYTKQEIALMQECIGAALDQIEAIHAVPARMVEKSIYVLGISRLPARPSEHCSASVKNMIGAAVLGNFHEKERGTGKFADALVHEAIHQVIYKLELENDFYIDHAAAARSSVVSPWSGQDLKLDTFVDASFVWFGLLYFWNASSLKNAEFRELRDCARRGFLKSSPASFLTSELRSCIQSEVLLALEEMWDRVSSDCVA